MQCPKCKVDNTPDAQRCDCGYDFATRRMPEFATAVGALDAAAIARGYDRNTIIGQRMGAWILDLFMFLVLLIASFQVFPQGSDAPLFVVGIGFVVYFIGMEGALGATLGKLATKLRVVDIRGNRPGYVKAAIRFALRLIELNPFLIGGLPAAVMVMASDSKQRLGDMAAGTYVIFAADIAEIHR